MDPDDLFLRRGHQAEGIGVAEVALLGEGQRFKIVGRGDRGDPGGLELLAIEIVPLV